LLIDIEDKLKVLMADLGCDTADLQVDTKLSEEHTPSTFRDEETKLELGETGGLTAQHWLCNNHIV
jgi:hypothetical protein